jgi:hypothetical protein
MKLCPRCGRILHLTEFGKNRHTSDKHQIHCRACQTAQHRNAEHTPRVRLARACGLPGSPPQLKWSHVLSCLRTIFHVPL